MTWLLLPVLAVLPYQACVSVSSAVTQTYTETEYRSELVSETYTEQESRVIATVLDTLDLTPLFTWSHPDISFSKIPYTWYYAYEVPAGPAYDSLRLQLRVLEQYQPEKATVRMLDMSRSEHIYAPDPEPAEKDTSEEQVTWPWFSGKSTRTWLIEANNRINQAKFLAGRSNLWSKEESPVLEADAGKPTRIAVIVSGPLNQWNARTLLTATWLQHTSETYTVTGERQVMREVPYPVEKQKTVYEARQVPFWEVILSR